MAQLRPISESAVPRGVHGGLTPDALPDGYLAQAANASIRGGKVKTRPRFRALAPALSTPLPFRGAGVYSLESGDRVIAGFGPEVWDVTNNALLYTFPTDTATHYHVQADRFFLVQNGTDRPLIIHGDVVRVAAEDEIPAGTIMAYAHGRVYFVPKTLSDGSPGGPYWVASDIMLPLNPENVLKMTEDTYWAEGGATGLPFEAGFIQGISILQNSNTGNGAGALVAFGRTGVSAYAVSANRTDWKNLDFSQVLFTGAGTRSPKSIIPVNNDLLFRGTDGIRSLRLSASQSQGEGVGWSIRPVSYEVSHRLALDPVSYLPSATASFADNRVLFSSVGGRGLLSLDTLVMASLSQGSAPAYDDLWVHYPVLATLKARVEEEYRHVILFSTPAGPRLATLSEEDEEDFGGHPVKTRVYTRAYSGAGATISLQHVDLIFRDIRGPLSARVLYRSDFYPRWTPAAGILNLLTGQRRQVRFSAPTEGCREDGSPPHVGGNVQLCIEWTGVATLERWTPHFNVEQADSSMLMPCSSINSSMSSALDLAMETLNDIEDLSP